jgi:hypothetical protein
MESYDILVIILSVTLVLSLIIWISVGVLTIQVLKSIKKASETAQAAVENVEEFTSHLRNAGKATFAGSVINQLTNAFKGKKDDKK